MIQQGSTRVAFYITALAASAVGAVLVLTATGPTPSWQSVLIVGYFCAIGWLSRRLTYDGTTEGARGRANYLVFPAAALAVADWTVPLAVGLTALALDMARGAARQKMVFNTATALLASAASILAFQLAGGLPWSRQLPTTVGPFLALYITMRLVHDVALAGVLTLAQGQPFWATARAVTTRTIADDVVVTPVVGVLAYSVAAWGFVVTTALALSLIAVNRLYQTVQALSQLTEELLELMVGTIEARDPYTSGHSRRVSRIAMAVARVAGLSERQVGRIGVAGLLHDVGKVHEKYAEILRKPDRLTPAEWALMKEHPADGEALVRKVSRLHDLLPGVRHHHEKWDGSGYPDGLVGDAIPMQARILAFADTIDAMTSTRPYRRGLTPDEVRAEIARWAGKQFDPGLAERLLASPAWPSLFESGEVDGARYGLTLIVDGEPRTVTPTGTRRVE